MRRSGVGQTGQVVLSDDAIQYKLSRRRTVRYQYQKIHRGWIAWICGPFHSRMYGAIGYGTRRIRAKVALRWNLANNFGYIGNLLFSDVDESDTVGIVDENTARLSEENAAAHPITFADACGAAGQ